MLGLDVTWRQRMLQGAVYVLIDAALSCNACLADELYLVDEASGLRGACLLFMTSMYNEDEAVEEVSEYFVWIDRPSIEVKRRGVGLTHGKIRDVRNFVTDGPQKPSLSVWAFGKSAPQRCLTLPVESGLVARWIWQGENDRSRVTIETLDVRPGAVQRWSHCRTIDFESRFSETEYMSGAEFFLRKHGTAEFLVGQNDSLYAVDQATGKLSPEPAMEKLFRSLEGITHRERATAFLTDDRQALIWWPKDFFRFENGPLISEFSVSGQAYSRSRYFVICGSPAGAELRVTPKPQRGRLIDVVELQGTLYCVGNYRGRIKLSAIEGEETIELPYAASLSDPESGLKSVRVDAATNSVIAYGASITGGSAWYCEWPLNLKLPVARQWNIREILQLAD